MRTFVVELCDATHQQRFEAVESFVGEDASGSFGILPRHQRMMTALVMGMARLRLRGHWRYLAVPEAMLYFRDGVLQINCRHYLLDDDYQRISRALHDQLLREEEKLQHMKHSLYQMEEALLKRLWALGHHGAQGLLTTATPAGAGGHRHGR